MKKLKMLLHTGETRVQQKWESLSRRKQKKFLLLFFTGYLLITSLVIITVWNDAKVEQKAKMDHIQNPITTGSIPAKKLSLTLKNYPNERK